MKTVFLFLCLFLILPCSSIIGQQGKIWTLGDCIDYALNRNIEVRKSELTNQSFQYYATQAKAQRYPSVDAGISQNFSWTRGTANGSSGFTGSNGSSYSVNSAVTLFNASRTANQIKQAELDIEGGKYSLETTRESISLSILDAYLQVLYAEELQPCAYTPPKKIV